MEIILYIYTYMYVYIWNVYMYFHMEKEGKSMWQGHFLLSNICGRENAKTKVLCMVKNGHRNMGSGLKGP